MKLGRKVVDRLKQVTSSSSFHDGLVMSVCSALLPYGELPYGDTMDLTYYPVRVAHMQITDPLQRLIQEKYGPW